MLDRKASKKNAYVKKEYTKGYKIPLISVINCEIRRKVSLLFLGDEI